MMIIFLVLLLLKLRDDVEMSWFGVFSPLWLSDSITVATSAHELHRIYRLSSMNAACAASRPCPVSCVEGTGGIVRAVRGDVSAREPMRVRSWRYMGL